MQEGTQYLNDKVRIRHVKVLLAERHVLNLTIILYVSFKPENVGNILKKLKNASRENNTKVTIGKISWDRIDSLKKHSKNNRKVKDRNIDR